MRSLWHRGGKYGHRRLRPLPAPPANDASGSTTAAMLTLARPCGTIANQLHADQLVGGHELRKCRAVAWVSRLGANGGQHAVMAAQCIPLTAFHRKPSSMNGGRSPTCEQAAGRTHNSRHRSPRDDGTRADCATSPKAKQWLDKAPRRLGEGKFGAEGGAAGAGWTPWRGYKGGVLALTQSDLEATSALGMTFSELILVEAPPRLAAARLPSAASRSECWRPASGDGRPHRARRAAPSTSTTRRGGSRAPNAGGQRATATGGLHTRRAGQVPCRCLRTTSSALPH